MPRALVKNAADPDQVAFGKRKERSRADHRLALVQTQLETYAGREFVWEELERHGIHDLVHGPRDVMYAFLGKREAGIELLQELLTQHADAFLVMQREALARATRSDREVEAAHTPSVTANVTT
jgi:hypothetical protein